MSLRKTAYLYSGSHSLSSRVSASERRRESKEGGGQKEGGSV